MKSNEPCFPFVTLKLAMSLDACVAPPFEFRSSESTRAKPYWISCEESRVCVQDMRASSDALMVGVGTVLADDPHLTNRSGSGKTPVRVVLDPILRAPLESRVLSDCQAPTMVFTSVRACQNKVLQIRSKGVDVIVVGEPQTGRLDLAEVLSHLFDVGVRSVLCEGGALLAKSLLESRLVSRLVLFISPQIIGTGGVRAFPVEPFFEFKMTLESSEVIGADLKLTYIANA